jgi:hypothetical protein
MEKIKVGRMSQMILSWSRAVLFRYVYVVFKVLMLFQSNYMLQEKKDD